MGLLNFFKRIGQEFKVLTGEKSKNKEYTNENTYMNINQARAAFEHSRKKLFDVNGWSKMRGINSDFILHDQNGKPIGGHPEPGYYIKIELPGLKIENWVQITEVRSEPDMAEFTVHPSEKPQEKADSTIEVKHFLTKKATSTFRVTRKKNILHAYEIGRNEAINNKGIESGSRPVLNTLIAEGGWAGFQKIQWDKLTKYLVHCDEVKTV